MCIFCNFTILFVLYSHLYFSSHGFYRRKKIRQVRELVPTHHWSNGEFKIELKVMTFRVLSGKKGQPTQGVAFET